jgi:hypothetical protein
MLSGKRGSSRLRLARRESPNTIWLIVQRVHVLSCVQELAGFDLDRAGLSTCTFRLDGDLGQVESDDPVERGERFGA